MNNYRVLIIKLAALGDAVMASTMINAIRQNHPEAHITWMCGTEIVSLVECFKGIDEIITVNNKLLAGNFISKVRFMLESWKKLSGRKYDLCLVAHSDKRYRHIVKFVRSPVKRAFGGRNGPVPGRYYGDEYARLALGHDDNFTTQYPHARTDITPSPESNGMVLLLPGGAKNAMDTGYLRRWPIEYYVQAAKELITRGKKVGIIGGPGDMWVEEAFRGLDIKSFVGKLTIKELLGVIAGADGMISHDSGPLHMCYMMNTPIIALFGPLHPIICLPDEVYHGAMYLKLPCSPCYDGRYYAKCSSNICMQGISCQSVIDKLTELKVI